MISYYHGVEFIKFNSASQDNPDFFEASQLQDQVSKLSRNLAKKEEECASLKNKVESLTQQKNHRDQVIEEHKAKQQELRDVIEKLKKTKGNKV